MISNTQKIKSVFLVKVPYAPYFEETDRKDDFKTKATFGPVPSLALASVCAFIEKYKMLDYQVKAVDVNIEAYTIPGIPIDTSVYPKLLEDCIKNNEYDLLGLSAPFIFNLKWIGMAVKLSKKYHPNAKIVVGGGFPTLFPERCLNDLDVDDVIIGEGEATFLHILNRYNNHHDAVYEAKFPFTGYASKDANGNIDMSHKGRGYIPLDDLPAPAWEYLDTDKYFRNSGTNILEVEGSRGCPYNCTYCCTFLSWGRTMRYKNIDNLINEIAETHRRYPQAMLEFIDDNISFEKEWITKFLRRLIDLKLPLKINASNLDIRRLDEEIIDLLLAANIHRISIAVETGSKEIQSRIKKKLNFDRVKEVVRMSQRKGAKVYVCWMLGFPKETMDQIHETFNFARELKAYANQFLIVLPYPGTKLFEEAQESSLLMFDQGNLGKFDNRARDYLISEEWNSQKLQDMIYDMNIELNFLNNPELETPAGREFMLNHFEKLLMRLPEHIVTYLIVGYLHKQKGNMDECEKYYNSATELFQKESLSAVFKKYLSWDHPIINDYNQYLSKKELQYA
jgi:radical SAM superfamily enzyme YgiQ (UPF0313 family)